MFTMEVNLNSKQIETVRHIRNYLVHSGQSPSVRVLMKALGYKSPRSAAIVINALIEQRIIKRRSDGSLQLLNDLEETSANARTVAVPLVGTVSCGYPILAQENLEAFVPVSKTLAKPGGRYFLLRAKGDSMNAAGINEGDLVLVKQQSNARNGDIVVALIDDEATIKEFFKDGGTITLKPRSHNKVHQPIILSDNFLIQGVVVKTVSNPN